MGAWGVLVFDSDDAIDWTYGLDDVSDLSLVESTFAEIETIGGDYLDSGVASSGLAACELLARLQGNAGYNNSFTKTIDDWVVAHPMKPPQELLWRADSVIDRVLGEKSELRDLFDEGGHNDDWREAMSDLSRRLHG